MFLIVFSLFLIPLATFAATSCPKPGPSAPTSAPTDFAGFVCILLGFMNTAFPIIVGATLLVFFWGLAQFIRSAGDEKKIVDGKRLMFWGIVALFVMVSIWGIINLLYSDFFTNGPVKLPVLPTKPISNP